MDGDFSKCLQQLYKITCLLMLLICTCILRCPLNNTVNLFGDCCSQRSGRQEIHSFLIKDIKIVAEAAETACAWRWCEVRTDGMVVVLWWEDGHLEIYKRVHFFFLCPLTCRAALVAVSNTSLTPSLFLAEHSRYPKASKRRKCWEHKNNDRYGVVVTMLNTRVVVTSSSSH